MVTSTSISGSAGSYWFVRASRSQRCAGWSGSVGKVLVPLGRPAGLTTTGQGYVTSGYRVKPAILFLVGRRTGRSCRRPASTGSLIGRGDDGDVGLGCLVRVLVVFVVFVVLVILIVIVVVAVVFFVVEVVFIVEVFVVEIDLFGFFFAVVFFVVSIVLVVSVVAVSEVVVVQVFFRHLQRDLLLQ